MTEPDASRFDPSRYDGFSEEYDHDWNNEPCWQCGGEGYIYNCFEEYACVDPESGCDLCMRRCDVCRAPPE